MRPLYAVLIVVIAGLIVVTSIFWIKNDRQSDKIYQQNLNDFHEALIFLHDDISDLADTIAESLEIEDASAQVREFRDSVLVAQMAEIEHVRARISTISSRINEESFMQEYSVPTLMDMLHVIHISGQKIVYGKELQEENLCTFSRYLAGLSEELAFVYKLSVDSDEFKTDLVDFMVKAGEILMPQG